MNVKFVVILFTALLARGDIVSINNLEENGFDVIIFVSNIESNVSGEFSLISNAILNYAQINPAAFSELSVVPFIEEPAKRIINCPTGPLDRDFDDSRRIYEAAVKGIKTAYKLHFESPLLVLGPLAAPYSDAEWLNGDYPLLNLIMGASSEIYVPLELREAFPANATHFTRVGVYKAAENVLRLAIAMEEGRRIARDVCGSDPERMAAPRVIEYLREELKSNTSFTFQADMIDPEKFPLTIAVNRAVSDIERHNGRTLRLEYVGDGEIQETVILAGKGVTFDSGGATLKLGISMNGMHRDKCGAAAVVGFFKSLLILRPKSLRVVGLVSFVRNGFGANSYIPDEIITTLAGRRLRVVNTDAEGRMILADLLYYAKQEALNATNPSIFSIATLTGHSIQTYGYYSAIMDNGPAKEKQMAKSIQAAGALISDMFEISTLRREDYEIVDGQSIYEDIMQSYHRNPATITRAHQFPAVFMMRASGLDDHGVNSEHPLAYTHMDITPAAGTMKGPPTAVPIMALTLRFVVPNMN